MPYAGGREAIPARFAFQAAIRRCDKLPRLLCAALCGATTRKTANGGGWSRGIETQEVAMRTGSSNQSTMRRLLSGAAVAAALLVSPMMLPAMAGGVPALTDIVRAPTDLPAPLARRAPAHVTVNLETTEVVGRLADGTSFSYWTFNNKVPGPFIRVRVGDTVTVNLANHEDSAMIHNVDFHSVTGPGGGAEATAADPGEAKSFTFKALNPGLYVYHCAVHPAALHIANGMYGMILVEPEEGLPKVDHEFYVMQGEIYTEQPLGEKGEVEASFTKLLDERPEYFVFNGAVGALTEQKPLKAKVGETVRIFFGVGGPNYTSSFHVIGEIFDKVYAMGDLTGPAHKDVQTISVAPGGAAAVEFELQVPGRYVLVDHALSRVQRGLAGFLDVTGPENPGIFRENADPAKSSEAAPLVPVEKAQPQLVAHKH
jgi:nitrite reductase (NO-forming)